MTNRPAITRFSGRHRYLSNFWYCRVEYKGIAYTTSEAAYQAQKTLDRSLQWKIAEAGTPWEAKALGRKFKMRSDWDEIKLNVMRGVVMAKFMQNEHLAVKLIQTGDAELIEGNTWNDTFWGVCRGEGENYLGKTLMQAREDLDMMGYATA